MTNVELKQIIIGLKKVMTEYDLQFARIIKSSIEYLEDIQDADTMHAMVCVDENCTELQSEDSEYCDRHTIIKTL